MRIIYHAHSHHLLPALIDGSSESAWQGPPSLISSPLFNLSSVWGVAMVCLRFSADTLIGRISSTSVHMTFAAIPGSFQTSRPAPSIFPLAALADIPFGGIGVSTETGLYYAEIEIATPSKAYYVQVDTRSDILWPNCICKHCPKKSDIGIKLILYDLKSSSSRSLVSCDESFCSSTYGGDVHGCIHDAPYQYTVLYGDESSTTGYFVTDLCNIIRFPVIVKQKSQVQVLNLDAAINNPTI